MTESERLNLWLDQWEEQQAGSTPQSLDEFIARQCRDAAPRLIERFRQAAFRLIAVDRRIKAIGVRSDDASAEVATAERASVFQAGSEPVPGYRLEEPLGRGGFGEVWKATAPGGFAVALKFVRLGHHVGESELRSLEAIKDYRHPHLLAVFGAWQAQGHLIVAMELAEKSLEDRLHEVTRQGLRGIPREELLKNIAEGAQGLDFLHEPRHRDGQKLHEGVQHRDVKPSNLLLVGRGVKVADYGLARVLEHSLTGHTGSMTVAYSPPEFFQGQTSRHSDQYSLAVSWCQLRGGRLPFTGDRHELMTGHLSKEPDLTMIPAEERAIVGRALAKAPDNRWPSCSAFVEAMRLARPVPLARGHVNDLLVRLSPLWDTIVQKHRKPATVCAGVLGIVVVFLLLRAALGGRGSRTVDRTNDSGSPVVGKFAPAPGKAGVIPAPVYSGLSLAVLDFENHSADVSLDGFRRGFRDMLATDLSRVRSLRVVERSRLQAVLDEHKLAAGDFIDPRTAPKLGKGLAARSLLTGSYVISGDRIRIDVRLLDVETGTVSFADSVSGTKSDVFGLQKAVSAKVLAGLKAPVTDLERSMLDRPQTKDFEAFRLYSQAQRELVQDRQKEAEAHLRQAISLDPKYDLPRQQLNALEIAALVRLSDAEKQGMENLGKVGAALQEDRVRNQRIVTTGQKDARYFAALIALSAHAGLRGDEVQEEKLLRYFWAEFTATVPVEESIAVHNAMQPFLRAEGKFFQETVDGGRYELYHSGRGQPEQFLKPGLAATLRWPKYATIWPFDFTARNLFGRPYGAQVSPTSFERALPQYPHDYLRLLRAAEVAPGSKAVPSLHLSITGYYAGWNGMPEALAKNLLQIQWRLCMYLERVDVLTWDAAILKDSAARLDRVAATATDGEIRRRANQLVLRFVRQARLSEGDDHPVVPRPGDSKDVTFCTLTLSGPRIVFLVDLDPHAGPLDRGLPYVQTELADTVRAFSPGIRFNILQTGSFRSDARSSCFTELVDATVAMRKEAVEFIHDLQGHRQLGRQNISTPSLSSSLGTILDNWPRDDTGRGEVCIVSLGPKPLLPADLLAKLGERPAGRPKLLYVGKNKVEGLAKFVHRSTGSAVLLDQTARRQVFPSRWDVSGSE